MKKSIYLFIAFVIVSTNINAQGSTHRETLEFGMRAGLNFANVYDSRGEQFQADGKFGFAGGGFLTIPMGTLTGIQPEILISQKGFRGSGTIFGSPYAYTHTTTYLDVPIFFAVKPTESMTFLAGPQFSYLLKSNDVFTSGTTTIAQEQEFQNDEVRRNTVSFAFGLDVNLNHFVIGGRAAWDLFDNRGDGTSETPRYKNQWVQLTLGYKFFK